MTDTFLDDATALAEELSDAARRILRDTASQPVRPEIKHDGSPVTEIDEAVEDKLREIIAARFPDHGVLGEEREPTAPDAEYVWVIDPIDGTLPFLAGFPVYGTLIALVQGDTPLLGVIDMPIIGERWIGRVGQATRRNGAPVRTRACEDLSQALLSTSNQDFYGPDSVDALAAMKSATALAVYGGSCLAYAQLASGRIDVGMDVGFDVFDYLALVPVIEGAGGVITDWSGRKLDKRSGDRIIAAGDARAHRQALSILSKYAAT